MTDTQILTIVLASAPTMLAVLLGILVIRRSELQRVEEVLDARLKHLEER